MGTDQWRNLSRWLVCMVALALAASSCGSDANEVTAADAPAAAPAPTEVPTTAPVEAEPEQEPDAEEAEPVEEAQAAEATPTAEPVHALVQLELEGLPALGSASTYEAWAIADAPISLGRFAATDELGEGFALDPSVDPSQVRITIEPIDDADPAPASTTVLVGDVIDGAVELSVDHPDALGSDFADVSGRYLLGTPTDGQNNNELSGVWFIDLPLAAGLLLPELPAGWTYEGWAVIEGVAVTTGRFAGPDGADDFDGFSGDQGGPPFPGEDFIIDAPEGLAFPTDLRGSTVMITVEPAAGDEPEPFAIVPLRHDVAEGIGDHVVQVMDAVAEAPTGRATIRPGGGS